jgi:hypothetical protein
MRQARSGGGPRLVLGAAIMLLAASPAAGAPRVALVVGNSAYEHVAKLVNPAHDAADVAAKLKSLGFDVELERDLGDRQLKRAVRKLATRAEGAEAVVFFYAGHGVQKDRVPYLVPTDAEIAVEGDLALDTVPSPASWGCSRRTTGPPSPCSTPAATTRSPTPGPAGASPRARGWAR